MAVGIIQGKAHKVLQSDSTQTSDHIQKCFRQKFTVEEGRHTQPAYLFISGNSEATPRSTPLFKMESYFFSSYIINDFKTNSATYNTRSF